MNKKVLLSLLFALPLHNNAFAGREGNGGEPAELIFKQIAQNIQQWIASGNADEIKLPHGISLALYKKKMIRALNHYTISFTESPIFIGASEKACRNKPDSLGGGEILCNDSRFYLSYDRNIDDVYRLVHHEFAGLAGLEVNRGAESDYFISDQISGYQKEEVLRRLPVVKNDDEAYVRGLSRFFDKYFPGRSQLFEDGYDDEIACTISLKLFGHQPLSLNIEVFGGKKPKSSPGWNIDTDRTSLKEINWSWTAKFATDDHSMNYRIDHRSIVFDDVRVNQKGIFGSSVDGTLLMTFDDKELSVTLRVGSLSKSCTIIP